MIYFKKNIHFSSHDYRLDIYVFVGGVIIAVSHLLSFITFPFSAFKFFPIGGYFIGFEIVLGGYYLILFRVLMRTFAVRKVEKMIELFGDAGDVVPDNTKLSQMKLSTTRTEEGSNLHYEI